MNNPFNQQFLQTRGNPGLPNKSEAVAYFKGSPVVDTIGLSVSDYNSVPEHLRDIFFSDASTMRSTEDIMTNIEASTYLNDGGELVGTAAKGYALYADGTSLAILDKAYRFFRVTPPITATYLNLDHYTNMEHYA